MNELQKKQIQYFWTLYEKEGQHKAMTWLESHKYYIDYCNEDISEICNKMKNLCQKEKNDTS